MEPFNLSPTDSTPKIIFDPQQKKFEISGISRPENVREYYEPVLEWIENFNIEMNDYVFKNGKELIIFDFKLNYFNSASAKFILDILIELNKLYKNGLNLKIDWYYDEGDEDMKEVGEELSEIVDFSFNYIEVESLNDETLRF
ncbi:MAG: DUF1987 domain-containing protein [Bacteroidales bacterium]|nr:DUF1987 domain-containing protein [Bacteroidales bacterium]